jgi:hypothetical protein
MAAPLKGIMIKSIEGIISSLVENLEVPESSVSSSELLSPVTVPEMRSITPQKEINSVNLSIFERLRLKRILEKRAISKGEMFWTRAVMTSGKYLMHVYKHMKAKEPWAQRRAKVMY